MPSPSLGYYNDCAHSCLMSVKSSTLTWIKFKPFTKLQKEI